MKNFLFIFLLIIFGCEAKKSNTNHRVKPDGTQIINSSFAFIAKMEGERLKEYTDYGHKNLVICYGNDAKVFRKQYKNINKENCELFAKKIIQDILVDMWNKGISFKDENEYIAIISIIYNLKGGINAFTNTNAYKAMHKYSNEATYNKNLITNIISEYLQINKTGNIPACGLLNRREKELLEFFKKDAKFDAIEIIIGLQKSQTKCQKLQ